MSVVAGALESLSAMADMHLKGGVASPFLVSALIPLFPIYPTLPADYSPRFTSTHLRLRLVVHSTPTLVTFTRASSFRTPVDRHTDHRTRNSAFIGSLCDWCYRVSPYVSHSHILVLFIFYSPQWNRPTAPHSFVSLHISSRH